MSQLCSTAPVGVDRRRRCRDFAPATLLAPARPRRRDGPRKSAWTALRVDGRTLIVIQRQLGHNNLGVTSVYLQGIDSEEIIETVHARRGPMIPAGASLRL